MSNRRPVRSIDIFYDTGNGYAVPRDVAESIFRSAAGIVGRHTGAIALAGVRGMRLPDHIGDSVRVRSVGLGQVPHAAFVTGRRVWAGKEDTEHAKGGSLTARNAGGTILVSRVGVTRSPAHEDPTAAQAVGIATHELAHSFGLPHCANECIMQPVVHSTDIPAMLMSGRPFCDPCAEDLELAGYQALAAQL